MIAKNVDSMAAPRSTAVASARSGRERAVVQHAESSARFDWTMALLGLWLVAGIHLDGWAHQHVPDLETFFTPWHASFYSAFAAIALVLGGKMVVNMRRGYSWRLALPAGYMVSALGVALFFVGGIADMVWHTLLGIEVDVEALLSPSHLLLATGGVLMITGPLRSLWQSAEGRNVSFVRVAPAVLSATAMLGTLTFFTQYGHPFATTWAADSNRAAGVTAQNWNQGLAMMSTLFQTALLIGFVLLLLRRWNLPVGSITLILGLDILLLTLMRDGAIESTTKPLATGALPLVGVAIVAGFAGDLLVRWLKPSPANARATRVFAFVLPVILYGLYYLVLALSGGIRWTPPVWSGGVFLAGIAGLLTSYLAVPPSLPEAARAD